MHQHLRSFFAVIILFAAAILAAAQSVAPAQDKPAQTKKKSSNTAAPKDNANKTPTAESVAESSILIYGGLGGRKTLDQIRKTAIERGKMNLVNAQGLAEPVSYQKWIIRGENLNKEKIRLDEEFPALRYSLVFNDAKTVGVFNEAVFTPRDDATRGFEDRIYHGLEALLRYKENESTIELAGHEKIMGVDFFFIDVTDKQGRKSRFYISSKTYRVMMIDYEEGGTKYRRKFYNYNYAQGTLVPYRTTLTAGDKVIEESEVLTVTFGQKVDEDLFKTGT